MNFSKLASLLLIALLCVYGRPAVARSQVIAEIAAKSVRDDVFPQASVDFPEGVVAYPQVEVSNLDGFRPIRMDIYTQRESKETRPAVLWIHGGGWSRGDARASGAYADWPAVLASLAARGFVVASLDYRLTGEARFPAQIQDVKAAIRHLRSHAAELGVDASSIYLWGGSAGAHLAALAATTCGVPEFEPEASTGRLSRREMAAARAIKIPAGQDCVQGTALWYGLYDLEHSPAVNIGKLLDCDPTDCTDKARAASPLHRVDAKAPTTLLIHGTKDKTAPPDQSAAMVEALRRAGVTADLIMIPGADHGWMGATPAETRKASLIALDSTFAFFEALAARR